MRRIGLFGGTFDPVHNGHLDIGQAAVHALALDELIVLVSNIPPHRPQPVASSHHRFAMVAMAIAGRPRWRVSDIELRADQPSFTADTLRRLHQQGFAPTELFFVLGADACADIATWKDYPAIFDLAHFAVVSRPGFPVAVLTARLPLLADRVHTGPGTPTRPSIFLIDAVTTDVSSTAIRRRLAAGDPVDGMVPPAVRQHIEQHQLYAPSTAEVHVPDSAPNTHRPAAAGRLHGEDR